MFCFIRALASLEEMGREKEEREGKSSGHGRRVCLAREEVEVGLEVMVP